jgi:hypothetical protein
VNRFCSIFSQLLQLFSRVEFQQMVRDTRAERHARGFPCWAQFVSMLFCHLGRAQSLGNCLINSHLQVAQVAAHAATS